MSEDWLKHPNPSAGEGMAGICYCTPHATPLTRSSSAHPPPVQTAAPQQLAFPASLISSLLDFRIVPFNPPLTSFNTNGQQFWVEVN